MKSFIVIALLVASTKTKTLTSTSSAESRITNGKLANEKQFPYTVGLRFYKKKAASWCGGTLISNQWILTAVHCSAEADSVDILIGALDRKKPNEKGGQIIKVKKENLFDHEKYEDKCKENDIALIKLPSPVELNDNIKPAKLPKKSAEYSASTKAIASGWGLTNDKDKTAAEKLHWVEIPILDNAACKKYHSGLPTQICIETTGGTSTCYGDSGGPLVLADGSNTLIGITSMGLSSGCEKGKPVAFTNVAHYIDWIAEKSGVVNK